MSFTILKFGQKKTEEQAETVGKCQSIKNLIIYYTAKHNTYTVHTYYIQYTYILYTSMASVLTQKYSTLNPGIFRWLAPIWCMYWKKLSRSSRPLIPSSRVFITLFACSASSIELICSSFVLHWRNFSNIFSKSWFSSNNLVIQKKQTYERCLQITSIVRATFSRERLDFLPCFQVFLQVQNGILIIHNIHYTDSWTTGYHALFLLSIQFYLRLRTMSNYTA